MRRLMYGETFTGGHEQSEPATLPDIENKKLRLSCRRETAWRFVSLNILLSHPMSFEMTLLSKACVSPY